MFVVVAIVIFGIFIGLTYTLFGSEGLSNDLKGLFENAIEQSYDDLANKKWVNILSNEDTRTINSNNNVTHPIINEVRSEKGESYNRIILAPEATGDYITLWLPIPSNNLATESLSGEDIQYSLSYRFSEPNLNLDMVFRYYDEINTQTGETKVNKGSDGWNNITVTTKNLQGKLLNYDNYYGFVTLIVITDTIDSGYLDIKDVNLSIKK